MDLQTTGNIIALQRKQIRKLKAQLKASNLRIVELERKLQNLADEIAQDVLGINGPAPKHQHYLKLEDYDPDHYCLPPKIKNDSIFKDEEDVFGPLKKNGRSQL